MGLKQQTCPPYLQQQIQTDQHLKRIKIVSTKLKREKHTSLPTVSTKTILYPAVSHMTIASLVDLVTPPK